MEIDYKTTVRTSMEELAGVIVDQHSHGEVEEFIMQIDNLVGDVDFTEVLIHRLIVCLREEYDTNSGEYEVLTETMVKFNDYILFDHE